MALTYIPKPTFDPEDPIFFSGSMHTSIDSCMANWVATYVLKQTEDVEGNALTGSYFVIGHGLHYGAEIYLEDLLKAMTGKKKKFKSKFIAEGIRVYFEEIARLGGTEKIDWPSSWAPLSGTIDAMLTAALEVNGITFTNKQHVGKVRRALGEWLKWLPENAGINADGNMVFELAEDEKTPFDEIGESGVPAIDTIEKAAKRELFLNIWLIMWNSLKWPEDWASEIKTACSIDGFLTADRFADWTAWQLSQFPKAYAELDVIPVANELNLAPYNPKEITGVKVVEAINLWLTGTADHVARDNKTKKLVLIDWKTAADAEGYNIPGFAQRSMQLNHYYWMIERILADTSHPLHKNLIKLGFKEGEKFGGVQYVLFIKKTMPAGWSRGQLDAPADWPVKYKLEETDEDETSTYPKIVAAPRATVTDGMRDAFLQRILEAEADLRNPDRILKPSAAGAYNSPCSLCNVSEWCTTGKTDNLVAITYNIIPSEEDM